MTNNGLNTDCRRFNTDIAGSRPLWSRHRIVCLFRRFIRESRPVSTLFADDEKFVLTGAPRLDPRLARTCPGGTSTRKIPPAFPGAPIMQARPFSFHL